MSGLKILVSGAGVAGPVLAHFLARAGAEVTIVERAASLRMGGQNVDIRGLGRKVLAKMGIHDAVQEKMTHEAGVAFVDGSNRHMAEFPVDTSGGGKSMTAEIEIMRGDLAVILYDATKKDVEYQFDDSIETLDETNDKVRVKFQSGRTHDFDLVIGADGLGSSTRKLVFGDVPISSVNSWVSWFKIPRQDHDTAWATWYNAPGRRMILLRPNTNEATEKVTRASMWVCEPSEKLRNYSKLSKEQQKILVHEIFHDAGGGATRCLEAIDKDDEFTMQEIAQVKMDTWSKGRVALLGDAAFCPSPISGMGTTLALVGAYVLAGEISKAPHDPKQAFSSYERIMRPMVTKGQKLLPGAPKVANPASALGIKFLHSFLGFVSWSGISKFADTFAGRSVEAIQLPNYDFNGKEA
ncbi:hypothetical protein FKW77_009762 [Venturia effusa]|uniref:FAD-binding domain-containing protein n=1 Tax=Venturia effusa TaxID=50376 RepID=A0A517KXE6_9PEZI|nr:hypothetical protein FKW77_009762 [Venturia effusa]